MADGAEKNLLYPGRRQVLAGLAAGGAGLLLPRGATARGTSARIDIHHHITPPSYLAMLKERKMLAGPAAGLTATKSLEDMDKAGVTTAILSVVGPGVWFGDAAAARKLARASNEETAKQVSDYKGRFGMWATLPLPDTDGALAEIAYALDTLKADGIQLWTDYGDKWLGDPAFDPVFEELNRRKAVIYTHPRAANCCGHLISSLPAPLIEFGTDTTRSIGQMVFGGAAARYPDIRIIWSHAGGTMPFLIERFDFQERVLRHQARTGKPDAMKPLPHGVRYELRKFYYGTAQAGNPVAMTALRKVVPVSQILFGSDFPYRDSAEQVRALQNGHVFNAGELRGIFHDNVARIDPRYSRT